MLRGHESKAIAYYSSLPLSNYSAMDGSGHEALFEMRGAHG
jgi:hypothetical protein